MKKILSLIKYVLLAIGVVMAIFAIVNDADTDAATAAVDASAGASVSAVLTWTYILLGIAIFVSVSLPIVNIVQNPKGAIRSLIGLGVVVLVVGIAYAMSSDEVIVTAVDTFSKSGELKLTDTGLYTAYIALGATVLVAVLGEIRNSFK